MTYGYRLRRLVRLAAALLFVFTGAMAAGLKDYSLSIAKTGHDGLDDAVRSASRLSSLHDTVPETLFALADRARGDIDRIEVALNSFGYYQPSVVITIDGRNVASPRDFAFTGDPPEQVRVKIAIAAGPRYDLGTILIDGAVPDGARAALGIKTGDPALAKNVLDGQGKLLAYLREHGYAFAKVAPPIAYADDASHRIEVSYPVDAGQPAVLGKVSVTGSEQLDPDFALRVAGLKPGTPYKTSTLDAAKSRLMDLGVFSAVAVPPATAPDADGAAPVTLATQEQKPHSVSFSADYSTDLGVSLSASWKHRDLFGEAEQLTLSAAATGLGGNATSGIGYDVSAAFLKPYFLRDDQSLGISASAVKQSLDAYDQTAEIFAVTLNRKLAPRWSGRGGLSTTFDDVTQEGDTRYYQLISLPLQLRFEDVETGAAGGTLADARRGGKATLSVTPITSFGAQNLVFAQIQLSGAAYFDMLGDGRSILALRGLIGTIQGASGADLPPDQRLYAGGSGTVRGFRYQSIGPSFSDGNPAGATSVDAASIEWRQRVWGNWGAVAFLDAGQAGDTHWPFAGEIEYGAGAGVRYYTPIGAVRLDLAVPLTHVPENDSFQVYISLGQAF